MSDAQKPVDAITKDFLNQFQIAKESVAKWPKWMLVGETTQKTAPPTLTPPDGWEDAVAGARRSYLYKDGLKQSEETSICKAIIDMDAKIKEQK